MPGVRKVLFFSPFAFIWPHALPEFQLAQLLHDEGLEVKVIGCRGSYSSFCTSMEAARIDVDENQSVKDEICKICISNSNRIKHLSGSIQFATVEDYPCDDADPGGPVEAPKLTEEILNCSLYGISIGRLALYETLIKFKKFNMDLTARERRYFETYFANSLKVARQAGSILKAERPDVLVCYSPQYVYPGIFAAVAARENIRVIFIEGSSNDNERYSHLRMWDWHVHGLSQPAMQAPKRFKEFELTPDRAARARKLVSLRASSKAFSAYTSAARSVSPYEIFGIEPGRKYILIAMSSYDEVYSGYMIDKLPRVRFESNVFKNQIEWLQETIKWASLRPELLFVVRPHPREFPNKREGISSPHEKEWSAVLSSLPPNVKLDHPDLRFSLYDHFDHIETLVTGWSSTGVEALSHGIPVVSYDEELPTFPKSIHYSGRTRAEYFENILRARQDTDRNRHIKDALRWLAYASEVGTIRVGGRLNDRFPFLTRLLPDRLLGSRLFMRADLLLGPSKGDAQRALQLIRGQGTSFFHLSDR